MTRPGFAAFCSAIARAQAEAMLPALPAVHLPPARDRTRGDPLYEVWRQPQLHRQRNRRPHDRPLLEGELPEMERMNVQDTLRADLIRYIKALLKTAEIRFEEIEVPA